MDKATAGKLDGMLLGARAHLEAIADHVREATPEAALQHERLMKIGCALTDLLDLSREIYAEHPELNPHREAEQATAAWRASRKRPDEPSR